VDFCPRCKLSDHAALRGEQLVAGLPEESIDRHPDCGHVLAYRSGGRSVEQPLPVVTLQERAEYVRKWRAYVTALKSGRS